ncbi:MAG: PEP-CTERM sorting domain-containing protein [Pirellulaceae bacterium]
MAATNKIWSQAGISFNYLPFTSIISPTFFKLENQGEVDDLFAQAPGASVTPSTISMWFVNDHFDAYGEANALGGLNANRIVVSDSVFQEIRLDTIAHELGHLLGLRHDDPGVETNFLMRGGDDRITPTTIGSIFPDGTGLDRLTSAQIATALADPKVSAVPEPTSLVLVTTVAAFIVGKRRRKTVRCQKH